MYKFAIKTLRDPRNQSDPLQIPFSSKSNLIHVYLKRSSWLTFWARAWLDLLIGWLEKWPQDKRALLTVVFHHAELWKNACATCHDTTGSNQLVHMQLSAKINKQINISVYSKKISISRQSTPTPPCLFQRLEIPQGRAVKEEFLFMGSMDIFWNVTLNKFSLLVSKCLLL